MNIVVDEDLPRLLSATLAGQGHRVFDIRDTALRGKSDADVFRFAQENKAILFSADLGFSNILAFPLGSHYGIFVLRFPNEMSAKNIVDRVKALLEKIPESEFPGNLIICAPQGIRIRRQHASRKQES